MPLFNPTHLTVLSKTRHPQVVGFASLLILVCLYLFSNSNIQVRRLHGTLVSYSGAQPASKLPQISNKHQLSQEELAVKINQTSDITCGGIDVNSILHVKAATLIDPDLDAFLRDSENYVQLGLPPATWQDEEECVYWKYLNAIALWRPDSRTYWTINRIYYYKDRPWNWPVVNYAWWEEWNEAGSQRVGSGRLPIFIPQHEAKWKPEGPEDPRLFEDPYGHVCFVFSMLDVNDCVRVWMYNTTTQRQVALHSPEGREAQQIEKNWTPFIHDGRVKFVFSYKPVTIIACDFSTGVCHFDYAEGGEHNPGVTQLHGGSNWVPWYDSGFYIGFPHIQTSNWQLYRLCLVVLSVDGDGVFRIAYASGPLDLHNATLLQPLGPFGNYSDSNEGQRDDGRIMLGRSISRTDLFDRNSIMITVSTSDRSSALLEVGGIRDVMDAVVIRAEWEREWRTGDGKVVDCAEAAGAKYADDYFGKNQS